MNHVTSASHAGTPRATAHQARLHTLVERYVKQLNDQEDRLATLRTERSALERQREERARALVTQIDALSLEPGAAAAPCR